MLPSPYTNMQSQESKLLEEEEKKKIAAGQPIEGLGKPFAEPAVEQPEQSVAMPEPVEKSARKFDFGSGLVNEGIKLQSKGTEELANIEAQAALEKKNLLQKQMEEDKLISAQKEVERSAAQNEINQLEKDYADTKLTDPDIWGRSSTGGKIFLTLGALLSSASNQGAQAFRSGIQNLIDRDIDIQKANLAKKREGIQGKKSLYAQLMDKYKNDDIATALTRKTALDLITTDLESKAAGAKNEITQGKLKMMAADAAMERDKAAATAIEAVQKQQGESKKTLENRAEAQIRYNNIIGSINSLEDKIKKTGTFELYGPEDFQKEKIIYDIALDYAKLVDPASVAREGEVAAAQKYMLPVTGFFRSNKTAKGVIKDFRESIDRRAKTMGLESVSNRLEDARGSIGARKK